jgi:hypothetical protein
LYFNYFGNTTASTTWIKPLFAARSVATTVEVAPFSSVKITLPSLIEAAKLPPLTVFKVTEPPPSLIALTTAVALKLPAITW